ncbi:hypothetical protein BZA70DRAFT_128793 [Myxozyma melibiosi]|uniref:DUF1754-domain-containing protein n=1 Tax=Myxozyma melibiosi TaxID=54550 RepID=A0ABR1F8U4_9ASCO
MAGSDYSFVSGGSLKIKGAKIEKKKKKAAKAAAAAASASAESPAPEEDKNEEKEREKSSTPQPSEPIKTESERKFEELQRKRMEKELLKKASKSHKEKVQEYNKYLASLSEHNDMPKIGPG